MEYTSSKDGTPELYFLTNDYRVLLLWILMEMQYSLTTILKSEQKSVSCKLLRQMLT